MPTVTVPQVNPNDEVTALSVNQGPNAIATVINGQLDDANVAGISGSKISSGTLTSSAFDTASNPETRMSETFGNFVASGCIWSVVSGLNGSMSAGVVYINGKRVVVSAIASQTFVANRDTYISVDVNGTVSIASAVTNNAASPALPANSIWLGLAVSGASLTYIAQGFSQTNNKSGFDTNANPIYPVPDTRAVGRAIRNSTASSGVSGTQVSWNGMPSVAFQGVAGRTYEIKVHEPYIDGFGGSGLIQLFYGVNTSTTYANPMQRSRSSLTTGGSGIDTDSTFTTTFTGLQYVNIQMVTGGVTGTLSIQGDPTYPAVYSVEQVG